MVRPALFAIIVSVFCLPAWAATLHIDMTPKLAGEGGVTMEPVTRQTTRFSIRISTKNDPKSVDSLYPFVRRGSLDVRADTGRILRCSILPERKGQDLLYSFDLDNEHAKNSSFTLVEHVDNDQVGGGKVFSYQLIDFIDPDYRTKELLQQFRPVTALGS